MYGILQIKSPRVGQIAVELIMLSAVVVILITGLISLAASFLKSSVRGENRLQAFAIAEAGIEYYRWHLAHAPQDFQDGTGHAGPYVHNYYDKDGNLIGTFTLTITSPVSGSTIVNIQSSGTVIADSSVSKIVKVRMGIPSFAKYAWALNDNIFFGTAAQVYGPIYSNAGVHFNGVAHNVVQSALTTYTDPDNGSNEWAVYTDNAPADPQPPTALPSRPDVFMAGRGVGLPALDFTKLTVNLASIKSQAQASSTYFASSTAGLGYDLLLSTTTYKLYKVTALSAAPGGCTNSQNQNGWGTWSINTETLYATGTIPYNGNMFVEDNLWVSGNVSGTRVTIAAAAFPDNPATRKNIIVNHNLLYTNFDGTDAIALIAQNNVVVGLNSDNNLTVDGAVIAQNGFFGRYYYSSGNCGANALRAQLTTVGMIGSSVRGGFFYGSSGYNARTYNYDANLLYAPPPSFPLTTDQYSLISWNEVQ